MTRDPKRKAGSNEHVNRLAALRRVHERRQNEESASGISQVRWYESVWKIFTGILATLLALGSAYEIFVNFTPQIQGEDGATSPFVLSFAINNPSFLVDVKVSRFTCFVESVKAVGLVFEKNTIDKIGNLTIEPRRKDHLSCGISIPRTLRVTDATVIVTLTYRTLWFDRTPQAVRFRWYADATPPRWLEEKAK